jgi:hypothetical protein
MRVTDLRKSKAILNQICKENNIPTGQVWVNPRFKYIENVLHGLDVDFKITIYKGKKYQVRFVSGCFYPFILESI